MLRQALMDYTAWELFRIIHSVCLQHAELGNVSLCHKTCHYFFCHLYASWYFQLDIHHQMNVFIQVHAVWNDFWKRGEENSDCVCYHSCGFVNHSQHTTLIVPPVFLTISPVSLFIQIEQKLFLRLIAIIRSQHEKGFWDWVKALFLCLEWNHLIGYATKMESWDAKFLHLTKLGFFSFVVHQNSCSNSYNS